MVDQVAPNATSIDELLDGQGGELYGCPDGTKVKSTDEREEEDGRGCLGEPGSSQESSTFIFKFMHKIWITHILTGMHILRS